MVCCKQMLEQTDMGDNPTACSPFNTRLLRQMDDTCWMKCEEENKRFPVEYEHVELEKICDRYYGDNLITSGFDFHCNGVVKCIFPIASSCRGLVGFLPVHLNEVHC